jgi:hypothetical protein
VNDLVIRSLAIAEERIIQKMISPFASNYTSHSIKAVNDILNINPEQRRDKIYNSIETESDPIGIDNTTRQLVIQKRSPIPKDYLKVTSIKISRK